MNTERDELRKQIRIKYGDEIVNYIAEKQGPLVSADVALLGFRRWKTKI